MVLSCGFMVFFGAPYVPSQKKYIKQAFAKLYKLTEKDFVIDIGSGDGVVLRQASKLGARGLGFEINPFLVAISKFLSRNDKKINFKLTNYFLEKIPSETTVVYLFAVSRDIEKITNWLKKESDRLKKPIYLVTYGCYPESVKPIGSVGAHRLYLFKPLHQSKPQV